MMIRNTEVVPIASPNIPLGYVGIPYRLLQQLEIEMGDMIPLVAGGMTRFFTMWPPEGEWEKAYKKFGYPQDGVIFLSDKLTLSGASFGHHISEDIVDAIDLGKPSVEVSKDKESDMIQAVAVTYTKIEDRPVIVCISNEMDGDYFPDYTVRMSDEVRRLLGLNWQGVCKIKGRVYTVKQAIRGDLDAMAVLPFTHNVVFIHKNSVPDNVKAFQMPGFTQETTPVRIGDEESVARAYLEALLGKELVKDIEVEVRKYRNRWDSRISYKTWAMGFGGGDDPQKALEHALKAGLRSDLEAARDRINATLSKIPG